MVRTEQILWSSVLLNLNRNTSPITRERNNMSIFYPRKQQLPPVTLLSYTSKHLSPLCMIFGNVRGAGCAFSPPSSLSSFSALDAAYDQCNGRYINSARLTQAAEAPTVCQTCFVIENFPLKCLGKLALELSFERTTKKRKRTGPPVLSRWFQSRGRSRLPSPSALHPRLSAFWRW